MNRNCHSVQFISVSQSCLTLCDPMNCSMPGLLVHHQLPEFTQTHVHRVSDAIQPSLLSSPSPPALNFVHGVLKARILKWFAIPFSSGPHSVRPLHHDLSVLGGPTRHGLVSLS